MSVLDEICVRKREHITVQQSHISLGELIEKANQAPAPRGFAQALKTANAPAIIAEIKKASPSKGVIREDFDVAEIAKIYEQNGAACLSVLTDEPYFQGHDDYLRIAREACALPVLRKDFMLEPYQIYESRALGADCILLIMTALTDDKASELYELSMELGMDVLVEIHDHEELERALTLNPAMVGVNNRNLKTLEVDIQTSLDLAADIPDQIIKIAESGISDGVTIKSLIQAGYQGFLIGESLMRQEDIGLALRKIIDTDGELK